MILKKSKNRIKFILYNLCGVFFIKDVDVLVILMECVDIID